MRPLHRLTIEADNGQDVLFVCPVDSCGRRLIVKRSGGLVVLDRGDFFADHVGGTGGLEIEARITS
ncbi:MAG: hypothetical protein ACRDRP_12740 [Pseudonocardiaceae bacterium]